MAVSLQWGAVARRPDIPEDLGVSIQTRGLRRAREEISDRDPRASDYVGEEGPTPQPVRRVDVRPVGKNAALVHGGRAATIADIQGTLRWDGNDRDIGCRR